MEGNECTLNRLFKVHRLGDRRRGIPLQLIAPLFCPYPSPICAMLFILNCFALVDESIAWSASWYTSLFRFLPIWCIQLPPTLKYLPVGSTIHYPIVMEHNIIVSYIMQGILMGQLLYHSQCLQAVLLLSSINFPIFILFSIL